MFLPSILFLASIYKDNFTLIHKRKQELFPGPLLSQLTTANVQQSSGDVLRESKQISDFSLYPLSSELCSLENELDNSAF